MAENSGDSIPVETKEGEEEEAAASRDVEDEPETIQQLKQKVGTIYKILIFLLHILKGTYLPSAYSLLFTSTLIYLWINYEALG